MHAYKDEEVYAIYELGRLYYEMGYSAPAERVFNGLSIVDAARTPARIGLGLIKLDAGAFSDAAGHFRVSLEEGVFLLQAKLGLAAAFIGMGEFARAKSILVDLGKELESSPQSTSELRALWEAFVLRCEEG